LNAQDDEGMDLEDPTGSQLADRLARKEGPEIQVTLRSNARKEEFRELTVRCFVSEVSFNA
jgi:hypothetical protein